MSKIKWTDDQKKIIDARDCNVLVSAAAGSGKTAVLIERIFSRITDKENPVAVDRFVVVTFTKAAAAQMKERLAARLEKALEENPDDAYLQKQSGLIPSAHISTVHSFCSYVIQNYFHKIGLDPAYRQGTESELALLQTEVADALLEKEYTEQKEDFMDLANMNMFQRSDVRLVEMILELYNHAMSNPFPMQWIEKMERFLEVKTAEEWEQSEFCEYLVEETHKQVEGILEDSKKLLELCFQPGGPYYFEKHVKEVMDICEEVLREESYQGIYDVLAELSFSRMAPKKDETVLEEKKKQVSEGRNKAKELLGGWQADFFFQSSEKHVEDLEQMAGKIKTLLRLTKDFLHAYTEEKRERNLVDFNDLEQLALSILLVCDEETGGYVPSEVAKELSEHFEEIMIDEYQDSNRVQDVLLQSISRGNNIFMVGDVKQSIYRFRKACPELFGEKLDTYEMDENAPNRRIDLHQNFRSRENVLEGTNGVFEKIMHRDIGGVEYDAPARLVPGRTFPDTEFPVAKKIDAYIIEEKEDKELEGRLIVSKIKEMVNPVSPFYVEEGGEYRPAQYKDIVILVRSVKTIGQSYFDILTQAGIPAVMDHSQGFFETREISLMVSMLRVIDNPRQDIPLASVLAGPMFGFSEEELAFLRGKNKHMDLYDSLLLYEKGDELGEKIRDFLNTLEKLREKMTYATVAELIQDIYDLTGIYEAVMVMKDGMRRTANMDSLMEQARQFDETTYHGLYQFVRYLNRIREQQEEMGEVNLVGEEENVVRIMTIHKSKGLEFPICFVGALGHKLGGMNRSFLTIQPDLGIASPIVDNETRTKKANVYHNVLKRQNHLADLGEDMRVLYVAMTRAQEKLILVGSQENPEVCSLNYSGRAGMASYLDMLMPALWEQGEWFRTCYVTKEELLQEEFLDIVTERLDEQVLYNFDTSVVYDKEIREWLEKLDSKSVEQGEALPVKVSVSDLKIKSMEELDMEDFSILSHEETTEEMPVPRFMSGAKKEENRGAVYGTAWHQVMALIDFSDTASLESIRAGVEKLVSEGKLREEDSQFIQESKLLHFFESGLGVRMKEAYKSGRLYREQPFVMGKPACEIFPDRAEKDTILIQGIIDAYFETEEGIVLMDYKTDSLKEGEEDVLIQRYQTQMKLYGEALAKMLSKPVSECILYSFSLQREIVCPI